jgi:effector-binding domain-containing protein
MIDEPRIVQTTAQPTAAIRFTIPRAEIRNVMGPGLAELMAAVAAQGIAVTGPWFSHHFRMDASVFDFEIGVPVAQAVAAAGRVLPATLRATTAARTVYHGNYDGLGAAWGEFNAWVEAKGHAPAADFWECYLAGPESGPDPSAWRTELIRPLVRS